MNSRIRTPFYRFFLNPDYVAARSLRSLRSNNIHQCSPFSCYTVEYPTGGRGAGDWVVGGGGGEDETLGTRLTTICLRLSGEYLPRLLGEYSPMQPRSQGLSSYRPLGRAKMRDPGNEVVTNVH